MLLKAALHSFLTAALLIAWPASAGNIVATLQSSMAAQLIFTARESVTAPT